MIVLRNMLVAPLFALLLLPVATGFAGAQPIPSELKMASLDVDGKRFDLPYAMENAELNGIKVAGGTIVLQVETDMQDSGTFEMALPIDLIRSLNPQLSRDHTLESLQVYVSSRSLEQSLTFAGSRVTISGEFPPRTEQIFVTPSVLPARVPLLLLDVPQKWGIRAGDSVEIKGIATGIGTEQDLPVGITLVDSLDNQIASANVTAREDVEFALSVEIPRDSIGGFMDVIGTVDLMERPDIKGYDYLYVDSPGFVRISTEGMHQVVYVSSNSTVYEPFLMKEHKILGLLVSGEGEGIAQTVLVAPRAVIDGGLASTGNLDGFESTLTSNSTHSIVEMRYPDHESASLIQITGTTAMPEFGALSAGVAAISISAIVIANRKSFVPKT